MPVMSTPHLRIPPTAGGGTVASASASVVLVLRRLARTALGGALALAAAAQAQPTPAAASDCSRQAAAACFVAFDLPQGAGRFHYYTSRPDGGSAGDAAPTTALIVVHGHGHDADRSFEAGLNAVRRAGVAGLLVVAPLFQFDEADRAGCGNARVPAALPGDARWGCGAWNAGLASRGPRPIGAIVALDALIAELARQWPSLRRVTLAGFSAGAQLVQRSVGFAADPPPGVALRYVIASPSSWLYFDALRPQPQRDGADVDWSACAGEAAGEVCRFAFMPTDAAACPAVNRWKYGTEALPALLNRDAAVARAHYAAADVRYLAGARDKGAGPGAAYRVLDRSCAAMAQGPFRLQRAQAYVAYDRAGLAPDRARELVVVPDCGHDVRCVLGADAAREVLFSD